MHSRFKMENMYVVLGVHDRLTIDEGKARIYGVTKINVHPLYSQERIPGGRNKYSKNDIALLKLHKEITFDFYVRPICLPNRGM